MSINPNPNNRNSKYEKVVQKYVGIRHSKILLYISTLEEIFSKLDMLYIFAKSLIPSDKIHTLGFKKEDLKESFYTQCKAFFKKLLYNKEADVDILLLNFNNNFDKIYNYADFLITNMENKKELANKRKELKIFIEQKIRQLI